MTEPDSEAWYDDGLLLSELDRIREKDLWPLNEREKRITEKIKRLEKYIRTASSQEIKDEARKELEKAWQDYRFYEEREFEVLNRIEKIKKRIMEKLR
jgi:hypothetical protein